MNILITGATGFIGRAVLHELLNHSAHQVTALIRGASDALAHGIDKIVVASIDGTTQYHDSLRGIDVIIHTAAQVHKSENSGSRKTYQDINVEGTLNLANQALASGVKRFIFISTIKVNGEYTHPSEPFTADSPPAPVDPYAISKYEAEQALLALSKKSEFETVIIRPPLVYGPGVKANFLKLMNLIHKGLPLPFGSITNKRSLVSIGNLVNLICTCIDHPNAANNIFLVSDDDDLSTIELSQKLAASMGTNNKFINIPPSLLFSMAFVLGKHNLANRLLRDLQADVTKTKTMLDWRPSTCVDDAIQETAVHFLEQL